MKGVDLAPALAVAGGDPCRAPGRRVPEGPFPRGLTAVTSTRHPEMGAPGPGTELARSVVTFRQRQRSPG